jgi:hypothetical protein
LPDDRIKGMFKMIKKDIDGLKNTLIEDIDKMKDRVDSLF